MKGQQMALSVGLAETPSFGSYHPGPNTAAVQTLKELLAPGAGMALLLHGPAGSGKTHLALALADAARRQNLPAAYLSLAQPPTATALDGLSRLKLVVLDGLDQQPLGEEATLALVRLLDALKARSGNLLLTARRSAAQLQFERPDLATRIGNAASFGLRTLSDDDRARLLTLHAFERGLHLPEDVAHYLLRHLPRDVGSLLGAVKTLDAASLAQQRRLTIPFVQSVLFRS